MIEAAASESQEEPGSTDDDPENINENETEDTASE